MKIREYLRIDEDMQRERNKVTGTNTVYLSKAINLGFGCSFTVLMNRYRIDYLTSEALRTGKSIESISAEYAFWSRSTLYEAYRQHTGLTPHRYLELKKDESKKYEV